MVLARRRPHALGTTQSEGWGSTPRPLALLLPPLTVPNCSDSVDSVAAGQNLGGPRMLGRKLPANEKFWKKIG